MSTFASYDNVTVGLDGLVYATETGSPVVDVFNPTSLNFLREVVVGGSPLGLAVDAHGNIFTADASGAINEFDASGAMLNSWNPGAGNLTSIAVGANGEVVAGSSDGNLVLANESGSLSMVVPTNSSSTEAYVGFVEPALTAAPINSPPAATFTVGSLSGVELYSFGMPAPSFSEIWCCPAA